MPKLTYWVAPCLSDNDCYSPVAKTKRLCQELLDEALKDNPKSSYMPVVKRTLVYNDAFDLMEQLTSEGGYRGYSNS